MHSFKKTDICLSVFIQKRSSVNEVLGSGGGNTTVCSISLMRKESFPPVSSGAAIAHCCEVARHLKE